MGLGCGTALGAGSPAVAPHRSAASRAWADVAEGERLGCRHLSALGPFKPESRSLALRRGSSLSSASQLVWGERSPRHGGGARGRDAGRRGECS